MTDLSRLSLLLYAVHQQTHSLCQLAVITQCLDQSHHSVKFISLLKHCVNMNIYVYWQQCKFTPPSLLGKCQQKVLQEQMEIKRPIILTFNCVGSVRRQDQTAPWHLDPLLFSCTCSSFLDKVHFGALLPPIGFVMSLLPLLLAYLIV